MLNFIRAEFFKLRKQKLIPVLFIAVIAISVFSAFSEINLRMTPEHVVTGKESFANAFEDITMLFIVAVFAGFYIGSDFTNRTIQAGISGGYKRMDLILSKAVVFSIGAAAIMLLYPVTAGLIHTINSGWGVPFGFSELFYLLRTAVLGSVLNIGTAGIYVCLAFICRDIPKTICACAAIPVVFSVISSTVGSRISVVGRLMDYSTLSSLKYIASDTLTMPAVFTVVFSACVTMILALAVGNYCFSTAEVK